MNALNIADIKQISLAILEEFDRVCKKNGLTYSIAYGTLLGAVRHKGFIPWDDDIDVIMPRKDYEKFIHLRNQLDAKYVFVSVDTNDKYTAPLAKIYDSNTLLQEIGHNDHFDLGVYIDIFVYDYVPSSKVRKKVLFKIAYMCLKLWGVAIYSPRTKMRVEKFVRHLALKWGLARQSSMFLNWLAKRQKESAQMSNLLFSTYGYQKDMFPADKLHNISALLFEGKEFSAFAEWDYFLSQWYGNYMKLPPKEKQVTHHNFVAYYK